MNKVELVELLAHRLGTSRTEANHVLNVVCEVVGSQTAARGKVSITGFGVFEKVHREARTVRNPKTGAKKNVEALDYVRFRPGSTLKRMVAGEVPAETWPSPGRRSEPAVDEAPVGRDADT